MTNPSFMFTKNSHVFGKIVIFKTLFWLKTIITWVCKINWPILPMLTKWNWKIKANKLISDYWLIYLYTTNNRSLICSAILHNPMAGSFKTAQDFFHEAVVLFSSHTTNMTLLFNINQTKGRPSVYYSEHQVPTQLNNIQELFYLCNGWVVGVVSRL